MDMLVRIIKDWETPNLLRQTPGGRGIWDGVTFTLDPVEECDYVIVLNRIPENTTVKCPPENIWAIMQEPPVKEYDWLIKGYDSFHKVITSNESLKGEKYIFDSLALPWHVNKNYDELLTIGRLENNKIDRVSWITSNAKNRLGHQKRMEFLTDIKKKLDFDLFGRGFQPIEDKWDGISQYKYTLAVENSNANYYWTEKISDCFLSWTMPIYYGCNNIERYFPAESMVKIDIGNPQEALQIIEEAIKTNAWEKNIEAIAYARKLVLEKYQFFPFVSSLINQQPINLEKKVNRLSALPYDYPRSFIDKLRRPLSTLKGFGRGK